MVGEYVYPCDVPIGIFTLYLRFVKLSRENKSELFVLWLISDHLTIPLSRMASKDQRHKKLIVIKHCNIPGSLITYSV